MAKYGLQYQVEGMKFNVSEITEVIQSRRTIYPKDFSERKVHKELVEKILTNAIWAPNHGMTQPWRFKVFMNDSRIELSQKLGEIYVQITPEAEVKPRKLENSKMRPLQSSVVIALCMAPGSNAKIPEEEELAAVACAVQNMALTATAYGLGSFWSTGKVVSSKELRHYLGLEGKARCLGLFYLGYPAIDWPRGYRRPLEYFTEWHDTP